MGHRDRKSSGRAGELVQLLGLVVVGAGCALEITHRASIWLVVITVGTVIFAIGTKLKGK